MPGRLVGKVKNLARDRLFRSIHGNNLVYNTCWEDPRIDRRVLNLGEGSRVLVITSAGCNALDYLLDSPDQVHAVDVNARQNALLALKIALFQAGSHEDLFRMFGSGRHAEASQLYRQKWRELLPDYARRFWDDKIYFFENNSFKKSFYFYGTSGHFAWLFYLYLKKHKKLGARVQRLLAASSLEEQTAIYNEIEPILWNFLVRWVMKRHLTMAMLGVPRVQRQLIVSQYPGGLLGFLQSSLRQVFTRIPVSENYFWRVYLTGSYSDHCHPEYLARENFDQIRANSSRLSLHTGTITAFLKKSDDLFSHFVLLDHQDWLAWHDPVALAEEWRLILAHSQPGSKILLRSAAIELDFLPAFVREKVAFDEELAGQEHLNDRVGTYGSMHVGVVKA